MKQSVRPGSIKYICGGSSRNSWKLTSRKKSAEKSKSRAARNKSRLAARRNWSALHRRRKVKNSKNKYKSGGRAPEESPWLPRTLNLHIHTEPRRRQKSDPRWVINIASAAAPWRHNAPTRLMGKQRAAGTTSRIVAPDELTGVRLRARERAFFHFQSLWKMRKEREAEDEARARREEERSAVFEEISTRGRTAQWL